MLADREVVLDAEPLRELPHALRVVRGLHRRRGDHVIVEEHDPVGVRDPQDVGDMKSNCTVVSTSTMTTSPGRTRLCSEWLERIFSIAFMPMEVRLRSL